MAAGERFKKWIDSLSLAWKDRLRGWMASWIEKGIVQLMDFLEPDLRAEVKTSMNKLKEIPGLPDDIRDIFSKATEEPKAVHLLALLPYLIAMLVGFAMGAVTPWAAKARYMTEKLAHSFRLDPLAVITAWRRDPAKYAALFDDLKDQGWDDDRIEALKFFTLFIPTADEQTLWLAREVYEPDMIAKYGLDDELPDYEETDFAKIGVSPEQMVNKWRAHWEHASWMQIVEMLHRGLLTEDDVWEWFRLVEITPYWRALLIQTAYTWPTRVDVRRWWDMRTIDETELRRLYSGMGYRGVNLDNYILWTKVYVAFPDLMTRWSNGWITEDDVRGELVALGMPAARVEEMLQTKKKAVEAGQVQGERDLTKSEIYTGVKKGVITREEGIELLEDLNYTREQAEYILDIRVAAATGSPETYEEFKDLTTKYKIAVGREAKPMPEELKKAATEVVRLTEDVESLKEALATEERGLMEDEALPEAATKKRDELRLSLHRAEAELQRVKTEYDSQVAKWRYGGEVK